MRAAWLLETTALAKCRSQLEGWRWCWCCPPAANNWTVAVRTDRGVRACCCTYLAVTCAVYAHGACCWRCTRPRRENAAWPSVLTQVRLWGPLRAANETICVSLLCGIVSTTSTTHTRPSRRNGNNTAGRSELRCSRCRCPPTTRRCRDILKNKNRRQSTHVVVA